MAETYTLVAPIDTHKGKVSVLTLNRPKGRLFVKHGNPFEIERTIDPEGNVRSFRYIINAAVMHEFIADMAGLDKVDIDDLDGYDVIQLQRKVQDIVQSPPTPAT